MTNKEWLEYLANNAPDELAAWFDSEHVETANGTLDGDTAALEAEYGKGGMVGGSLCDTPEQGEVVMPLESWREYLGAESENEDSRERIEADVRKWCGKYAYQADMVWTWLNRQAAITEREHPGLTISDDESLINWRGRNYLPQSRVLNAERERDEFSLKLKHEMELNRDNRNAHDLERIEELTADRVKLKSQICKLEDDLIQTSDERDNWKANCDDWKKHARAAENACYETMLEREELQAKVEELTQIADSKRVTFADRIRFVDRIDELEAERDNLKVNNEQLHTLAGEQAAKIDELQSALDAICANLSIIATGEPSVIADIAIETIDALIDECNTANRQCNEYRNKFGKCLDYADAIHALMDEGIA